MPTHQAETPQKNPRGSRRPRRSAKSTPSHTSSIPNDADSSVEPGRHRESGQSTRILRRGDDETAPDISVVGNLELPNPTTPPRPRSMYDIFSNGQYQGNQSAPDMNQRRKKGRKPQGGITRASGVRRPEPNEASVQASPQNIFAPSRPNGTPVKAYAGPSFNASPAPSSLPMPKFSRSVPNVDKTSTLKSRMEQETADTTSESDGSPFLQNSQLTQGVQAREDSPLDIFFQADRDAKAKAQIRSPAGSNGLLSDSQKELRHHSRQATDSSLGGMFSLEMDGAASESSDSTNSNEPTTPAPKAVTKANDRDEQRRLTTLALQKLLFSPEPQHPASSSSRVGTPSQNLDSPSPKTTPREGSPGLVPGSTSREQQRQAALLALAQKQISGIGTNNGSAAQRPPSSKLRKELSIPDLPGVQPLELPATPTHSHVQKTPNISTNCRAQEQQNGYVSPYSPFSSTFTPPTKLPGNSQSTPSKDAKSIEEDLRRILKLDVLGGDNITGVRS